MLLGDSFKPLTTSHHQFFKEKKPRPTHTYTAVLLFSVPVSQHRDRTEGQGLAACPVPSPQPGAEQPGAPGQPQTQASGTTPGE